MHIVTDSALKNKQATAPVMNLPLRKDLPALVDLTADVRSKEEEDTKLIMDMECKCNEERRRLIQEGTRDEIKLRQQVCAPELIVGTKIQHAFRHTEENDNNEIIEWCAGSVSKVSNGTNLRNTGKGSKFCRKGGAVEVQWDGDPSIDEDFSYSIVEIKKTLFNFMMNLVGGFISIFLGIRNLCRPHAKLEKK